MDDASNVTTSNLSPGICVPTNVHIFTIYNGDFLGGLISRLY